MILPFFLATTIIFGLNQSQDFPPLTDENFVKNRPTPKEEPEIRNAFIYEDCKHYGNNTPVAMNDLILVNKYGLRIEWNKSRYNRWKFNSGTIPASYDAFDDIRGIFDCTITVKLGPHDKLINYQELIFGFIYWIQFDNDEAYAKNKSDEVKKLEPDNTMANKGLKELQTACRPAPLPPSGINCEYLGCVVITYGNKSFPTCYESESRNIGEYQEWFTRDDVTIRILLIGSFIGKNKSNENVRITFPPFDTIIKLDFTRLYAGPCENIQQFYCKTHGVCIKYALVCDAIPMRNCPEYDRTKADEGDAAACKSYIDSIPPLLNKPDPSALQNLYIFWILIGILSAFLAFIILNYLFWRPGYIIWRCGRIRNWFKCGNSCYKSFHSCSKGNCAQCCKTQGQYDTTEPTTIAWSKLAMGDGFHMRENR